MYNPVELAHELERVVLRGTTRRYYRLARGGRWYGGIATADCCGCPLRCVFCWSGYPRDNPHRVGKFYSPREVFSALMACARREKYRQIRVSGNEPTLGRAHLIELLELVEETEYRFILETNGILIDEDFAEKLSRFSCLHVRVSLKGTNPEEFSTITGAVPEAFLLQLSCLRNLWRAGVHCHPAIMSFSSREHLNRLVGELRRIAPPLAEDMEEEQLILYPHVEERLKRSGIHQMWRWR